MPAFVWIIMIGMLFMPVESKAVTYQEVSELRMERSYAQKLLAAGRYSDALIQSKRVLQISIHLFGAHHRETAMSLDGIGSTLRKTGAYREAEQYFQQAIQITGPLRQQQPEDHATALQNLAGLYREVGRLPESEQLYLEAIIILKSLQQTDNESVISVSGNLAILYVEQGRYADAEPLLKAEYEWARKAAEPDELEKRMNISKERQQLYLSDRMSSLGGLYLKMGRDQDAALLTAAALEIKQKVLADDDPRLARELNNLGMVYSLLGRHAEAGQLLQRSVISARKVYGNRHAQLAMYLDNLAMHLQRTGAYDRAEMLHNEAIEISSAIFGDRHQTTLVQRNNLAVNHLAQGRPVEAEKLLRNIIDTTKSDAPENRHPEIATRLSNLADAVMMQGKFYEGFRLQEEALRIRERNRDDLFQVMTEQQKLQYLQKDMLLVRKHLLLASRLQEQHPDVVVAALNVWLKWKGIVMESQGRYLEALYRSTDQRVAGQLESLALIRRQLAGLRLVEPETAAAEGHRASISQLENQKAQLENDLVRFSQAYLDDRSSRQFGFETLRKQLPAGTAYLDVALVEDWNFTPYEVNGARYLAFLVSNSAHAPLKLVDLGKSEQIEKLIHEYRKVIGLPSTGKIAEQDRLAALGSELYRRIMLPLIPYLETTASLLISPDGALNLLPFEVLRTPVKHYLIEEMAISYIGSGRDLARFGKTRHGAGSAVLFADPDYDMNQVSSAKMAVGGRLAEKLSGVYFHRLPDTRVEALAVAGILQESMPVVSLLGKSAVESALLSQKKPRILHLATHGFFLQGDEVTRTDTRGLVSVEKQKNAVAKQTAGLQNPMLRSGIVLAGVNHSLSNGYDDGLVTAEKILGMPLLDTELVTLSACETGLGDIRAGEGVFGLKRAFILAGARSVVLSLWSVPSRETTELMIEFYRLMRIGTAKAAALRQAQLLLLKKYTHPFYWGAFQLVGSPQ